MESDGKREYRVTEYGVEAGRKELQTEAVQNVIEICRKSGGGRIIFPKGEYYIGSIRLYSDMELHLESGAKVYGSRNYSDYSDFHVPSTLGYLNDEHYIRLWNLPKYYIYGIICAFGEKNVSVTGEKDSWIDGQDCRDQNGEEHFRGPMGIILSGCENVRLEGYTFINSANWSHQLDSCRNVSVRDITVLAGHDGLDLHHCTDVSVKDSRFETGDDCFAGYDVENLLVENCYINTACNAMRLGGHDIVFDRCVFEGPGHYPHISENTFDTHAVFKYYAIRPDTIRNDGGSIRIENSVISDVRTLFSYQYGKEELMQNNRPLRDIKLKNVSISGVKNKSVFKGNGEPCRIILENITLTGFSSLDELLVTDESVELEVRNMIYVQEKEDNA